jgi:drug/metabolite transporter (DMT)-like permease
MSPRAVLVFVTVLWGTTFIATKDIVRDAAPFAYLTLRFGSAAVILVAAALSRGMRWPSSRLWRDAMILVACNASGLIFQVLGQGLTTASKSAFITSLNTPLTPVVGYLLYRQRPSPRSLGALTLASFGVVLLTFPVGPAAWNTGDLLTLGCAGLYAWAIVEIARRTPHHDPLELTAVQLAITAAVFGACWLVGGGQLPSRPRAWAEIGYLAIVCTVVSFPLQAWAMARMSAVHAAIIFAFEPVFATAAAVFVDGAEEWPGLRGVMGGVLVIAGALFADPPPVNSKS